MAIYGTAILSFCLLAGMLIGRGLGQLLGMENKDIGGVGIAMLLLILLTDWLKKRGNLQPPTESGILFWSAIYIPVIVAMAASQNVRKAIHGGYAALIAGVLVSVACVALVPLFCRIGRSRGEDSSHLDP
ncbi:malonate transporter subunit MadL [Haloferula sp. BvORR071]|uniref:malonate transporter subunit MadL n=1 Tax=Haloferula sp. BvORR071 TaxID=1396141 RepID=UPI00054EC922|nr:malonate transporter subunit MadL [Haloferula sp. BvORR071]